MKHLFLSNMEGNEVPSASYVLGGSQGDENIRTTRMLNREVVIMLYTAKLYLPGLFERKAFLLITILLPFLDFTTDWINAGNGSQLMFQ